MTKCWFYLSQDSKGNPTSLQSSFQQVYFNYSS